MMIKYKICHRTRQGKQKKKRKDNREMEKPVEVASSLQKLARSGWMRTHVL